MSDQQQPKTLATLDDLVSAIVEVAITLPYGRSHVVKLKLPTYHRWYEVAALVDDPIIPKTFLDPVTNTAMPNPADPDYIKKRAIVNEKRALLHIVDALEGGGMEIPGANMLDKAEWLRVNLDAGIANVIGNFLDKAVTKGRAQIEAKAASFLGLSGVGADDVQPEGLDAGAVENAP